MSLPTVEQREWIKLRLPEGVTFNKNGVSKTIDQVIDASWTEAETTSGVLRPREYTLGMIYEVIASDFQWETESIEGWSGGKPEAERRAEMWKGLGRVAADTPAGQFTSIPATYGPLYFAGDEFSR